MAFVFHHRLAIPLWAIALLTVALTAPLPATLLLPPSTLFVIAVVAVAAAMVLAMPGAIPWLRTSRALVRIDSPRHRNQASAAIIVAAGTCVRPLDEPNRSERDDALDLVRMDDDGGWQVPRPPA
jgi:hypothetical protein